MRVPNELLYDVPGVPAQTPERGAARPRWAQRLGRTLGERPRIGLGIGMMALAAWLVAASMPGPSVAPAPVGDRATGAIQPTVTAALGLALQQGGTTPASPGDRPLAKPTQGSIKSASTTAPDALTAAPPSRATSLSRPAAPPTPVPPTPVPPTPVPLTPVPLTPAAPATPAQPTPAPEAPLPSRAAPTRTVADQATPAAPAPGATPHRARQAPGQTSPGLLGGLLQILGL